MFYFILKKQSAIPTEDADEHLAVDEDADEEGDGLPTPPLASTQMSTILQVRYQYRYLEKVLIAYRYLRKLK